MLLTLIAGLTGCSFNIPHEGEKDCTQCSSSTSDTGTSDTGEVSDTTDTGEVLEDSGAEPKAYTDSDGDGRTSLIDCDDTNATVYPDAAETCNGIDDDCDGSIDEDLTLASGYVDSDADGYGAGEPVQTCDLSGYATVDGDCNDADSSIHPGAEDPTGDGIDSNCDDGADNGEDDDCEEVIRIFGDADGDGYGDELRASDHCSDEAIPDGYVDVVGDCNDADASINPGASEIAGNGIDDDCSGSDASSPEPATDADADGYTPDADCDDSDATVNPGASEVAYDGIDQDCSGSDLDDVDGDGYVYGDDCDDRDATVNARTSYWWDNDQDGYGGSYSGSGCGVSGTLVVANDDDCDDSDAAVNPSASEYSAGIDDEDNDCDSAVDEDWQAYVEVEYPTSGYYQLNVGFYASGATPNSLGWQESDTESSGTTTSVEFLTSKYGDKSGACGLIINVSEGNPASSWLCESWAVDTSVFIDAWIDGSWYDESDVTEWIANDSTGSCAAIIQVDPSSACDPVDDN
jgi:hypothetical protein